jgi:hypothetical protein
MFKTHKAPHLSLVSGPESTLPRFPPPGAADEELEWFFTMAESDMGARSNFAASILDFEDDTIETRAEASAARRKIHSWLVEVGDHDAGVLKAAYVARPWPLRLRERLGRVTGVVVRLAAAQVGLPDDDDELDRLEQRTAVKLDEEMERRGPELVKLQARGMLLLRVAFAAYVRERGGIRAPRAHGGR